MNQQIVRISSLKKTLEAFEKAADTILKSGIVKTPEEIEAFKKGYKSAFDLIRKEYGIE